MSYVPLTQNNMLDPVADPYSTKVANLQSSSADKISRLGTKADSGDIINTLSNQYNPAEMQYILGDLLANKQLSPEGNTFMYGDNEAYEGPTGRFYAFGTNRQDQPEDPAFRDIKPGFAGGHWSNAEERYVKYPAGPEGVDTQNKIMDALFPEQTARAYEALVRGNQTALDQRVAPYSEELSDINKARFGSGYTEILGRREDNKGIFGDASLWDEITEDRKVELRKEFLDFENKVLNSMYPEYAATNSQLDKAPSLDAVTDSTAASTGDMFSNLQAAMLKRESAGDYKVTNQLGYVGGYQFGASALETLGYLKKGASKQGNSSLNNPDNWTGKNGIDSVDTFKNTPQAQDIAFRENTEFNAKQLLSLGVIDDNSTDQEVAGYLAASHLLGAGGARNLNDTDANGTAGIDYFKLGSEAVSGTSITPSASGIETESSSLMSKADYYQEQYLRAEAEGMDFGDRLLNAGSAMARTFTKEAAVDFSDWVGEGLDSITGGVVGWDNGSEEEKSNMVNQWFGFNPYAAEEDYAKAKVHADNIIDSVYSDKKDIDMNDAFQLVKIGITTPEMFGDSIGFLGSMFIPFLGWAGKGAKATKATKPFKAAGQFIQKNAGLLQMSAGNVNDQIDAYKDKHGEAPSVAKVGSMFVTEGLMLGLDRWADLSILKSPAALKGVRDAFSSLPKESKAKILTKAIGVTGGLVANMGKEAGQEYLQEIGQEFNVAFNFDDNGDLTSVVNEAGEVLLDKELQASGVMGAGLGAGGAVQFAGVGALGKGFKSTVGKGAQVVADKTKETLDNSTKPEEPEIVDTPAKDGFDTRIPYTLNESIVNEDTTTVDEIVAQVSEGIDNGSYSEELKNKDKVESMEVAKEAATVLGYSDNLEKLEVLITQVTEATGIDSAEVELSLKTKYAEAYALQLVEKEDKHLGTLLRRADNLRKAGALSGERGLTSEIRNLVIQTDDDMIIGVASSILGTKIERPSKETKKEKVSIKEATSKAQEVSKAKVEASNILEEVESKNYVLGSSKEALTKITELANVDSPNANVKKRVESAINAIAKDKGIAPEVIKLIRKTAASVVEEATIGPKGYKTYGGLLKKLTEAGRLDEAELVRGKLINFLDTQERAASALQEAQNKVDAAVKKLRGIKGGVTVGTEVVKGVVAGQTLVTAWKKSDGTFFDIRIRDNGYPVRKDMEILKQRLSDKKANVKGIQEALGIKSTVAEERVTPKAIVVEEAVEVVETPSDTKVEEPIVEEVVEQVEVKPEPTVAVKEQVNVEPKKVKPVAKEPEVKEEVKPKPSKAAILKGALEFAMAGLEQDASDNDIVSGIIQRFRVTERVAKKALEKAKRDETDVPVKPKEVIEEVLRDSLYKAKKAFSVVKGKAKLTSAEPTRGTTGVIQRNPAEYVKVNRETALNTIREFNEEVTKIVNKTKATLLSITKPLNKYEDDLNAYGALESADSPSRALLFNSKGELNDNVVLAIRAALLEALSFDKDLFSKDWKTKDDVARMFGKTNSNDISEELWNLIKDRGVMLDTIGNSLGNSIVSLLGLSEKNTASDIQNFARLKADLGGAAIQLAVADGLIEFNTVPATEFAAAMGEEATSKDSQVNFVSFKNEEATSKGISKESKLLEDSIPEVKESRSDIYLEGVPEEVVKRRTANYHNGKVGLTPSKTHQKALKKLMGTEWEFDRDLAIELLDNKEAFLRNAGYIDPESLEFQALSFNDSRGQKGKNRKVLNDVKAMEDMVNSSDTNTSLWFEWYSTVNQRVMIDSNALNPMNDKYGHRWVVQPKGMETKVSMKKAGKGFVFTNDQGTNISKEVRYALAQAFGMAVDKKHTKKIDKFANALLRLEIGELALLKAELLDTGKASLGNGLEAEVEHLGHTIQGLKFLEQVKEGKEFTTKLSAEFDAVTSGFGLKLLQMPIIGTVIGKNAVRLEEYLAKVGIVLPSKIGKKANSMNDLLDSKGFLDNYETLANGIRTDISYSDIERNINSNEDYVIERIEKIINVHSRTTNRKVWATLKNILPKAVEGEVNKELRNLFKDPFMTFNYSRSINNIKRGLAANILEDIVSKLTKTPIEELSKEQLSLLRGINTVVATPVDGVKGLRKLLRAKALTDIKVGKKGNLKQYLETFIELSYGEEVSRIFTEQFEPFIEAQDTVTESFKYAYEVFDYEYKKRLDRYRKLEGTLTTETKKKVLRELLEVFPLIDGPMSEQFKDSFEVQYWKAKEGEVEGNFEDGSLSVFKETRQRGEDILPTQFKMAEGGEKVINPQLKEFASPGVGGSVLPIHSIDAAILLNTFLDMGDMLLIHDAIIPKLDKMNASVKQYNKHVTDINRQYSFIASIHDMVKRVENFTNTTPDGNRNDKVVAFAAQKGVEDLVYTLGDMARNVVPKIEELANKVQNSRTKLFNDIDNDPDAKIMHMAGMSEGVYSVYKTTENAIKDEIRSEYSDTIANMLDNLQNIINKPCN